MVLEGYKKYEFVLSQNLIYFLIDFLAYIGHLFDENWLLFINFREYGKYEFVLSQNPHIYTIKLNQETQKVDHDNGIEEKKG